MSRASMLSNYQIRAEGWKALTERLGVSGAIRFLMEYDPGRGDYVEERRRTRPGAPWLKTALVQAAWVAARTKNTYLRAQFLRLKSRRGPKKAILAVAASMLTAAYYILKDGTTYADLGADYFDRRSKTQMTRRLVKRLEALGLTVEVRPAA